jgi:LysR family transcriptional regulator, glycine cleavage system transcriptional activator
MEESRPERRGIGDGSPATNTRSLRQSLPLLKALVAFEAAARRGSLTLAAKELNIAQSAVSRHVANLERQIGVELFKRHGNRIAPTEAGRTMAASIRDGLGAIRATIESLTGTVRGSLTVACSHDLAQLWLMPRFEIIASRVAHRRVRLLTSSDYSEFDRPEVDLSFRFGLPTEWSSFSCRKVFDGEWFPVCAPALLATRPDLAGDDPTVFLNAPLLHTASQQGGIDTWMNWIGPRASERALPGPTFSSVLPMMHEAIAGRGVALAWSGLIDELLLRGQLVRLSKRSRRSERAFYLVAKGDRDPIIYSVIEALIASAKR